MIFKKILLDAIYGVTCNEPTPPSYICRFIQENFEKLELIGDNNIEQTVKDTIKELKQDGLLESEFYFEGEFHVVATEKFTHFLGYEVTVC